MPRDDMPNHLVSALPGGIEMQESRSQRALVASAEMPVQLLHPRVDPAEVAAVYERLGFTVHGPADDDLFLATTMPEGWTRDATGHAMWSKVLDAQGRPRIDVFFKGAFYDRRAHATLRPRYRADCDRGEDNRMRWNAVDDADGSILLEGEWYQMGDFPTDREMQGAANAWLDEHYPDHADPFAYWS